MPITPTYPGVYIEEIPSGVRTITGVATSITGFIGSALRGPSDDPVRVQSFGDFERQFGGLWRRSMMSYAVQHYFLNGGSDAIIVRVHNGATKATLDLGAGGDSLTLEAASEGEWGNNLRAVVDYNTADPANTNLFNLIVEEFDATRQVVLNSETHANLTIEDDEPRFITRVLEENSRLIRVQGTVPANRPDASALDPGTGEPIPTASNNDGGNGGDITDNQISDPALEANKQGLWALEKADIFNLLCIPPLTRDLDIGDTSIDQAIAYCKKRRAMFLVDAPRWNSVGSAVAGIQAFGKTDENAAIFFPRLKMPDPLQENRSAEFAPCGVVAGIFARIDVERGIWKAPAGLEATLRGVREMTVKLTDGEIGQLNPLGVNCIRNFPIIGPVVWGARTLQGADRLASEWKYIPVRRMALYIEESLYRGTQWVVFEPNDEPLWAQIRLNVGAFMQNLFRQGAFQGKTPREAYLVKCDKETTTQDDINRGVVNILVGFAPLKPAEFVILQIQQLAGQSQS